MTVRSSARRGRARIAGTPDTPICSAGGAADPAGGLRPAEETRRRLVVNEADRNEAQARSVDRSESDVVIEHGPKLLALIVDDDDDFRTSVAALARREGFETRLAGSLEEARKGIADASPDLVLVDLQLPDGHGLELLDDTHPASDTEFVVVTGNGSVDTAVR